MISVCMATHNGEKYIKEQIDSILPQLSENDELIISDDGSTDKTCEIILQYNDPRIKLLHFIHPVKFNDNFASHRYASKNFENAISKAKGEYIFLCDQDDIWTHDKVSKCLDALSGSILVKHNGIMVNESGDYLHFESSRTPISKHLLINIWKLRCPGSHIAFRQELLSIALPFPERLISHDAWIGCLASYVGKCISLNQPLIRYRIHSGNVSVHKHNRLLRKIGYRINLCMQIISRIYHFK